MFTGFYNLNTIFKNVSQEKGNSVLYPYTTPYKECKHDVQQTCTNKKYILRFRYKIQHSH